MADKVGFSIMISCIGLMFLASCENGTNAVVGVRSDRDIQIAIPEDHWDTYCINSAEIRRYTGGMKSQRYQISWRIRLRPGASGPCELRLRYPQTPRNFITEVSSDHLMPGDYLVVIDGGIGIARAEFSIPHSQGEPARAGH